MLNVLAALLANKLAKNPDKLLKTVKPLGKVLLKIFVIFIIFDVVFFILLFLWAIITNHLGN